MDLFDDIRLQSENLAWALCEAAHLQPGQLVVVGCSSSEIAGARVGSLSNPEIGKAVFEGIYSVLRQKSLYLAAQCCEHLNRALILERAAAVGCAIVNVVPQPKAGGSFATAAYRGLTDPVAIEEIRADAGLDIGGTLIGMHLKRVAVPLRLSVTHIGQAPVNAARTRPKFIGGARAVYDERLF
ncbi:TIGR01440 family protein [Oscillospiraceae bacterium WX1]